MKKAVWILILVFALAGSTSARFDEETMLHSKTHTRFDEDGYDFFGYNASGYDREGIDKNGSYKGYRVKFETEGYAEGILSGKCYYKNLKVDGESTTFKSFMELRGSKHRIEYTLFHKNDFGTHINESQVVKTIDLSKGHKDTLVVALSSEEVIIN